MLRSPGNSIVQGCARPAPDKVALPTLAEFRKRSAGPGFSFCSSRFIEFPKTGEVLRAFNTEDYSGAVGSSQESRIRAYDFSQMDPVEAGLKQAEREKENRRRSRRALRLSVRGVGKTVQLLTLNTRDVFPWADRARFALAVKHFINNTRHIFGAYVVVAELTKREFCHAHLTVPDKTCAPTGHCAGYSGGELAELLQIWRKTVDKFKPKQYRRRRGLAADAPIANIHMTGSRQALGISAYMSKAASSYMIKEDSKLVFFSHRFRSSRGLVRVMPWHRCEQSARPRYDFSEGECEWYMYAFKDDDEQADNSAPGYCSAIYGFFSPP